jgi:hypothetical protein
MPPILTSFLPPSDSDRALQNASTTCGHAVELHAYLSREAVMPSPAKKKRKQIVSA